ncbi:hypothetical protein [Pluralibacter gergoviae]|uniref:hypothetical protein n=1 Tax=Enterobacteriaceae TaxID=543 RepID=UPI0029F1833F|nr:hypothetical protein [Klebsiella pneumoniae]MCP6138998.1 hypothetical protein [Klebsiella pneumoniae]HDH0204903.1 hypothetical protein [Klebsiella pneumoniae]HEJ8439644.1 hypothetical protein [Klebsiella oxytoca]
MNKLLISYVLSFSLCLSGCDFEKSKASWATAKVIKTEVVYGDMGQTALYKRVFYTLPDFDGGHKIFQANLSPLDTVKSQHGQMNIRLRTYSDGKIKVFENIVYFKD